MPRMLMYLQQVWPMIMYIWFAGIGFFITLFSDTITALLFNTRVAASWQKELWFELKKKDENSGPKIPPGDDSNSDDEQKGGAPLLSTAMKRNVRKKKKQPRKKIPTITETIAHSDSPDINSPVPLKTKPRKEEVQSPIEADFDSPLSNDSPLGGQSISTSPDAALDYLIDFKS